MPKRQGDTDDATRGRPGDQVEIGSDRAIEVLFEFREEGRRKRTENAASVNAQEAAPRLARSFVFSYQRCLLGFAQAGSTLRRLTSRASMPTPHTFEPTPHECMCDNPSVNGNF